MCVVRETITPKNVIRSEDVRMWEARHPIAWLMGRQPDTILMEGATAAFRKTNMSIYILAQQYYF